MAQPLGAYEDIGKKRSRRGGYPQKYVLDERGRRLLLGTYDGRTETIDMLVRSLGVPRWCITNWASDLGLSRQKQPAWSEEDIRYLERHLARTSIKSIASHLGRTQTAVRLKAKRLGLNKVFNEGYTARAVALGLGCDVHRVTFWITQGWLGASRRHTEQPISDPYYITDAALRDFIRAHPEEIELSRVEKLWFLDIVFSNERGGLGNLS